MLQASPEFKGIKTRKPPGKSWSRGFKPALNSKGLRLSTVGKAKQAKRFKPALNSKGLRPPTLRAPTPAQRFKPALNSKGLRLGTVGHLKTPIRLQASPEFKGIKT